MIVVSNLKPRIKSRSELTLFIFTLALLVFLSGALPVGAHEAEGHIEGYDVEEHDYTTTATDVNVTNRASMYNLLLHLRAHIENVSNLTIVAAVREKIATEGDDWRHDTNYLYTIRLTPEGQVVQHPYHPVTSNGNLSSSSSTVQELIKLANEKPEGDCVRYDLDGTSRWACAAKFKLLEGPTGAVSVWIVGYHHDFEEVSFTSNTCPYYAAKTSAIDVENAKDLETLKKFVDEFTEYFLELRRVKGVVAVHAQRHCQTVLPWKYGSIYLFRWVFPSYRSIFNANSPDIEGQIFYFEDENGCNLADEIKRVLAGQKRQCKSFGYLSEDDKKETFFEYLWENPGVEGDEINIYTECPNGPRTCAPGRSPKVGYVRVIPSSGGKSMIIIGSGYYPETQGDEDGDGCAIAGARHKAQGALLNLFLIISVLFSAVMVGSRYRARRVTRKKGGIRGRVFTSLFASALALLFLFSWGSSANAHEGDSYTTTAGEVDETDEGDMKNFVLHARAHWEGIETPGENIEFEWSLTMEGSNWNSGTIYLMAVTEEGSILVHGEDSSVQNGTLIHYSGEGEERMGNLRQEVQELIDAANGAEEGDCVRYDSEEEEDDHDMRVACAVKFKHPVWNANSDSSLILIAGYHDHDEHDDTEISFDGIECPYSAEVRNESPFFFQGLSANEVVDNETLKEFVEQFATHFEEQVNLAGRDYAELAVVRNCWRILPWRYEPSGTYIFIMTEDKLVFFNGQDPALENDALNLEDENGCIIGDEVVRVGLGGERQCKDLGFLLEEGSEGFIQYLWDDSLTEGNDINIETECPKGPRTCSPGRTPKVSYLKPITFLGQTVIIGSGYHPRGGEDDGDGCAIAGSGRSGVKGAVFSLLLVVSVLFSVVLWRNRSTR